MKTKQGNWPGMFAGSAAIGSGTFAIGALINELARQQAKQQDAKRQQLPENSLVVDLPKQLEALHAKQGEALPEAFIEKAGHFLGNAAAILAGAPAGYMGTKLLYDKWKKTEGDRDISDAHKKYMKALQSASVVGGDKVAATTPFVDEMCKAAAISIEKSAIAFATPPPLPQAATGLFRGLLNKIRGGASAALHSPKTPWITAGTLGAGGVGKTVYDDFLSNKPPQPNALAKSKDWYLDAMKILAGLSAAGTGAVMVNAARNKEKKEQPSIPSAVALNYENVPSDLPS